MNRLTGLSVFVVLVLVVLAGCGANANNPPPLTETPDFVYVSVENCQKADQIVVLNQWLERNPNKKVVSFSGVLYYREDVSGYVIFFVSGNNSRQRFEHVGRSNSHPSLPQQSVHGIHVLQEWKDAHPAAHLVAFSTVAAYSGGVESYTICYEQ